MLINEYKHIYIILGPKRHLTTLSTDVEPSPTLSLFYSFSFPLMLQEEYQPKMAKQKMLLLTLLSLLFSASATQTQSKLFHSSFLIEILIFQIDCILVVSYLYVLKMPTDFSELWFTILDLESFCYYLIIFVVLILLLL